MKWLLRTLQVCMATPAAVAWSSWSVPHPAHLAAACSTSEHCATETVWLDVPALMVCLLYNMIHVLLT